MLMPSVFPALNRCVGSGLAPLLGSLLQEPCWNFYHLLDIGVPLSSLIQIFLRDADLAFTNIEQCKWVYSLLDILKEKRNQVSFFFFPQEACIWPPHTMPVWSSTSEWCDFRKHIYREDNKTFLWIKIQLLTNDGCSEQKAQLEYL